MIGPRDTQQSKVYAWEGAHVHKACVEVMTVADAQALVNAICAAYDQAPPTVFLEPRRARSHYYPRPHWIGLARGAWGQRKTMVIHETAHAIDYRRTWPTDFPWHGPAFVALHIDLLVRYDGRSATTLRATALDCGVKVASPAQAERVAA